MKFKDLIKRLFLPLVLLLLCGSVLKFTTAKEYLFPQRLHTSDRLEDFYSTENPYAVIDTDILYDSGYDYLLHGNIVGRYYYSLDYGYCQLYLMDKKLSADASGSISGLSLKGLLVKMEEEEYETLISQMANDLNWSSQKLSSMTSPYILSTLSPLNWVHTALLAALLLCTITAAMDFIITILSYRKTARHHSMHLPPK